MANSALARFWGINRRTEAKLNKRGIFTIGDLAKYPYKFLKKEFGILGVDMHLHANGIDRVKYVKSTRSAIHRYAKVKY